MTEKSLSCYKGKGFSSLLVCFAFIFCRLMTFIRYSGVAFTFGVLNSVRYIEDSVISRFVIGSISTALSNPVFVPPQEERGGTRAHFPHSG